ncbi:hypothetical protein FOVG_13645 [Fusarium oxysporum f. sp. pisi HDV247]|uniref:Uncharacterized protein n=1 Tax=Fusarium oxysporum f. sp. pisi HDV247 TaxID=1080344 RepID=W9NY00_FUSOX|nr:hypothetical protein FOVG_13645 [Fusarium oxysporum f. sp. pisi HDV247]
MSALDITNAQLHDWSSILADVIARGYDVFSNSQVYVFTENLELILSNFGDADEAWYCACWWIDMLEQAQVNMSTYVEIAVKYCFDTWAETKVWAGYGLKHTIIPRVLLQGYYNGRMIPYWIKRVDSSCLMYELFIEFPALRGADKTLQWGRWPTYVGRYRHWKDGGDIAASVPAMNFWPLAPSLDRWMVKHFGGGDDDTMVVKVKLAEWAHPVIDLREHRFERKWQYKRQKFNCNGNRRQRMPRAWVE